MESILSILSLILFAITPAIFWFKGKRFLGEKTHPAAIFILSCFTLVTILSLTGYVHSGIGIFALALLWGGINFATFAIVRKIRSKFVKGSNNKEENEESKEHES